MTYSVYLIHHKNHSDVFSQGYVGVSKNPKDRWNRHWKYNGNEHLTRAIKKYGWNNLIKEIILIGEEKYCYFIENKLRNKNGIGWNIVSGGGNPPNQKGKIRSKETKLKKSGLNHHYFKKGELLQAEKNPNFKGSIMATNTFTGKQIVLNGAKEIILAGFTTPNVYACVNGKAKNHKSHTFKRLEV